MTNGQLEVFVMVADLRSFTAAALYLGISQSAVSHAIRSLEKELNVQLFIRLKADAEVTEIGSRLLLRAREMIGLCETIRQEAADANGLNAGTLRIGSFGPSSSLRLLPTLLSEYRRQYPNIEIHIDEGPDQDVKQWILDRRIDVGFVVLPEERFETYLLTTDQIIALLPSSHQLVTQNSVRLNELCSDPFIMTEAGSAQIVASLFHASHLTPNVRFRSAQVMSTLALVARGEGVSLLAELALPVDGQQMSEKKYVMKPLDPPVYRQIGLAIHSEKRASPATLAFIKTAKSTGLIKLLL
ncbi:LysR family transcriptional regulator [Neptunomonas sp.]|uniref:LysR family transcriptional regulator n=1 Tax=Neptunomonas sp. TaxID=1971898 RepID=UPI0025F26DA7|nr:LysR family transcriptional regulator [Neptunomonas sp.]